jgi:hypothetical protein
MSYHKHLSDGFNEITIPEQRPVAVYRDSDGRIVIRQAGLCGACASLVLLSHEWIPVLMDRLEALYAAGLSNDR